MLEIRHLTAADEAEWRRLWAAYLAFYETEKPEEIYQATWARLLSADHPNQNGLLALKDGQPIGLVHYIFHPSNWTLTDVCYLQDLYADPAVRGTGVGRALIEAVYAKADEAGAASVYWLTQEFNATARQLYDRVAKVTPFIRYIR
ncbi:MAG: GNAT family N-acetyltransferase [Rhodobacteraceae bacterium]|jgi:GNAT superfamily N-acetyltransferase|nr:GNAT family N-acetyltransferase [Paracoccaceae bacterium]